ncbi:MAG: DUF2062 domain-containing protein [Mariprofundaceae bacterium]|nr:DUF2062 domain-containing protein [Mariprofundaceae bacterium]
MPRKFLKKYLPNPKRIKNNKYLRIFGSALHDPSLWHFSRKSIAAAFAVGLFCAWVPVPSQMVLAAGVAILFHANLPVSVALVWVSNPITIPPMFYLAYKVGALILGVGEVPFDMELSMDWLLNGMALIWQPLLVGCLAFSIVSALLGYVGIHLLWRYMVYRRWRARKHGNPSRS